METVTKNEAKILPNPTLRKGRAKQCTGILICQLVESVHQSGCPGNVCYMRGHGIITSGQRAHMATNDGEVDVRQGATAARPAYMTASLTQHSLWPIQMNRCRIPMQSQHALERQHFLVLECHVSIWASKAPPPPPPPGGSFGFHGCEHQDCLACTSVNFSPGKPQRF